MMTGNKTGIIEAIQIYSVHEQKTYLISIRLDENPAQFLEARIAPESVYPEPKPGDQVECSAVLGTVIQIRKKN